ncbi:hypothetical protein PIB30_029137 [Stylosanthes scabra]|uniref:Uncharacterized protein n=1 Tax=Stylosanthes scabra TaxID=79078 RepID=A0ABU6WAX9_9FABA|nr:hypothetical protein [Stylosanthes scabra]
MGIPVHLWLTDTMMKIGKFWGKPVMMDEVTDYYLSYTCASILIDSFQWEFIHEWVVLEDGDRKYDVYVKEFGREMYNDQAHPGVCHESNLCREDCPNQKAFVHEDGNSVVVPEAAMDGADKQEGEGGKTGRRHVEEHVGDAWEPLIDDIIIRRTLERDSPSGSVTGGAAFSASYEVGWRAHNNEKEGTEGEGGARGDEEGKRNKKVCDGLNRVVAHYEIPREGMEKQEKHRMGLTGSVKGRERIEKENGPYNDSHPSQEVDIGDGLWVEDGVGDMDRVSDGRNESLPYPPGFGPDEVGSDVVVGAQSNTGIMGEGLIENQKGV